MRNLFVCFLLCLFSNAYSAKTIYDTERCNIKEVFKGGQATYVIRNSHQFSDTLFVPQNSEIRFEGGSLSGPIVFNNTELSGQVILKGSSIIGSICNETFDASWLCAMDGVNDDAKNINEMIEVCGHVYFPRGTYRLISRYHLTGMLHQKPHKAIKAHIGICKSDVDLIGESGATFVTEDSLGTICLFSQPNQIPNSISDITIKNITFNVHNDGIVFHEFLHTIRAIGVNGLTIENCTFNDFWGDAICLSHYGDNPQTGERTRNQNVRIINNTINGDSHNNRNGISVISGKNVLIKGNVIKNTSRKDMPGGVDVEPNNRAYTIENIRIEGNSIECVYGHAIKIHTKKEAPAHHIEVISNMIKNCMKSGIAIVIKTEDTSDSIIIQNNHVFADTKPYMFVGKGRSKNWVISDNIFECPVWQSIPGDITVENLVVKNNTKKGKISWVIENYKEYGFVVLAACLLLRYGRMSRKDNYQKRSLLSAN